MRWSLLIAVTVLLAPAVAAGDAKTITLHVKAITLDNPAPLPLALRFRIEEGVPEALLPGGCRIEAESKALRVGPDASGKGHSSVRKGHPKMLKLATGESTRTLLFFDLLGRWYAAPAQGWVTKGRLKLEILDADFDGRPLSKGDWVRQPSQPFTRVGPWHRIALAAGSAELEAEAAGRTWKVVVRPLQQPDDASELQLAGLASCNRIRVLAGLPPLLLDVERSRKCQLHATYLYLNGYDYSAPWDGVGSHEEVEGRPGYTAEGREAAHSAVTSGHPDPEVSVWGMVYTMMHRLSYLSAPDIGLGIGAEARSKVAGARGYSVVWGAKPQLGPTDVPVVLPAPGATGVPVAFRPERPRVEGIEGFYAGARGFPITVSHGGQSLEDARVTLYRHLRRGIVEEVAGYRFSHERPRHHTRPENGYTTMFVAKAPLTAETTYIVEFTANRKAPTDVLTVKFLPESAS